MTHFIIRATHHYYGPTTRTVTVMDDETGHEMTFATREAARAKIAEMDGKPYRQQNNEYGRPTLRVRKVD